MSRPESWDYNYAIDMVTAFRGMFRTIERLVDERDKLEGRQVAEQVD